MLFRPHPHVKHYHIKQNTRGEFYLSEKHCCGSIPDLVNYHRHNSGGLASRLKTSPCDRPVPPTAGLSHGSYKVLLLSSLILRYKKLGKSFFFLYLSLSLSTLSLSSFSVFVYSRLLNDGLLQTSGRSIRQNCIYWKSLGPANLESCGKGSGAAPSTLPSR